jgi:hypothetical protein
MKHLCLGLLICLPISIYGQWECPSQLGGSLKPLGNSKLLWGTEITGGAGYLTNNAIYNTMELLGVDYTSGNHTFYGEGGFKYWYRTDYDLNISYHNSRFGLRELYYQNHSTWGNISLGLQSMRSEENYLLNERVVGLNYKKSTDHFAINVFGGSVSRDFARNGTFCNMAYLFDILPYSNRTLIGATLGQTNMAGFTLAYKPYTSATAVNDDGLGIAEDNISHPFVHIESIGMALYTEFGRWVTTSPILSGLYSNIEIGNDYWFKPEVLYQDAKNNRVVVYSAKLQKAFTWKNSHRTTFEASYFGLEAIDKGAQAVNLFSNIFAGSVLRLDSPDLPFYQIATKYTIPSVKTHLKLQYTSQTISQPVSELDAELGRKFFGKLLINGTYGYIKSPMLSKDPNLFRVEMRFDF